MCMRRGSGIHSFCHRNGDSSLIAIGIEGYCLCRLRSVGTVIELTCEVELIEALARQAHDVRHTCLQQQIVIPGVFLCIVGVDIRVVALRAVRLHEEVIGEGIGDTFSTATCEESCTRSLEDSLVSCFAYSCHATEPVLMVEVPVVVSRVSINRSRAVEVSYLTIETCFCLLNSKRKTDALP